MKIKMLKKILFKKVKLVGVMKPPHDPLKKVDVNGQQGRDALFVRMVLRDEQGSDMSEPFHLNLTTLLHLNIQLLQFKPGLH